jgi:hypothetical protein
MGLALSGTLPIGSLLLLESEVPSLEVALSELNETEGFTVAEAETTVVANDGTIVSEDVKALLDEDGNPVALDDLVTVEAPDGSAAFDEVISVADEDGNLVPVEETVGVIDADGNIAIAEGALD